ncbi:MAG TPA: RNA polymerase subunit sigma-70 [Gaiellaceae bacterium]|nr:RNA polymerase subunit sigma-70 [Gaiellaceae bacterium]
MTEAALIEAARAGDESAFQALADRHARELHVHCYRMLGSIHDAEDALQDSLLRAWRHLAGFEGRSSFRAWLYRIATNVCLAAATCRPRPEHEEDIVLTPYPDEWLDELPSHAVEPSARYDLHESVQLALLAAVQVLPPKQRAVLLLRDVLGFSAREAAELLDASPTSVHSSLRRARAALERRRKAGRLDLGRTSPPDDIERSLVQRYVEAWESIDIAGLLRLLREDAVMTMPPDPAVFLGSKAIVDFFSTVPAAGALDRIPLVTTRANRQPAVAAYLLDPEAGVYRPYGIMVLVLDGNSIAEITGCPDPGVFPFFDLPAELKAVAS